MNHDNELYHYSTVHYIFYDDVHRWDNVKLVNFGTPSILQQMLAMLPKKLKTWKYDIFVPILIGFKFTNHTLKKQELKNIESDKFVWKWSLVNLCEEEFLVVFTTGKLSYIKRTG